MTTMYFLCTYTVYLLFFPVNLLLKGFHISGLYIFCNVDAARVMGGQRSEPV